MPSDSEPIEVSFIKTFYPNGQIDFISTIKNNEMPGFFESWNKDGSILICGYRIKGRMTGPYRTWHNNGSFSEIGNLSNGSATRWSDLGNLCTPKPSRNE